METKNEATPPPRTPEPKEIPDGQELTDEDLDMVVGGLNPQASMAYAAFLMGSGQRPDRRFNR